VILAALEHRPVGARAEKLNQNRVLGLSHVLRRALFDNFPGIQHAMRVATWNALSIKWVTMMDVVLVLLVRSMISSSISAPITVSSP